MANLDDDYVQINLPSKPGENLSLPDGDASEIAMSIHSQISRGLYDLQRGLELSALYKERTGGRVRRHSALPSVESSPIDAVF